MRQLRPLPRPRQARIIPNFCAICTKIWLEKGEVRKLRKLPTLSLREAGGRLSMLMLARAPLHASAPSVRMADGRDVPDRIGVPVRVVV